MEHQDASSNVPAGQDGLTVRPAVPSDRRSLLAGIGGLAAGAMLAGVRSAQAGPLSPPSGPVTSTNKTLQEVEPRIAINGTNTPGDADSVFRIAAAGSYYLTGNISASGTRAAIEIAGGNVTIDLQGFGVTSIGSLPCIRLSLSGRTNISIRNGNIGPGGGGGIDLNPGLGGAVATGGTIENIHVDGTSGNGIRVGNGFIVRNCSASNNSGYGIVAGTGCTITSCSASNNGESGFYTQESCIVNNCASESNSGAGISIGDFCRVEGCLVQSNGASGINAFQKCMIISNHSVGNGLNLSGRAITFGSRCHVEGNTCLSSYVGISTTGQGSFISRNIVADNDFNWNVYPGNVCFVVQAATNPVGIFSDSGGVSPGSTNPNANYTLV